MAPKLARKKEAHERRKSESLIKLATRGPSLTNTGATTSREPPGVIVVHVHSKEKLSCPEKCFKFLYNREEKTFCERTCQSWLWIIGYSLMYLVFLSTYTMIFLFGSLSVIKSVSNFKDYDVIGVLTYPEKAVGLSATPTAEDSYPLIWYRSNEEKEYQRYVSAIDRLLLSRRSTAPELSSQLGPCGESPYGYGDRPCVIIRINKQIKWAGKPLLPNSTVAAQAPKEVKEWLKSDKAMLWLHCDGYNDYDKEHIGRINYYPYPPGFDPSLFPLDVRNDTPLVAVQFSEFTKDVSLAVQCNLWYDQGPSIVTFVLYVEPDNKPLLNNSRNNTPELPQGTEVRS